MQWTDTYTTMCNGQTRTELRAQGRGVDQDQPGKEQQKGKGRRLEKAKRTNLRYNQMEALHEGPMLHIGTEGGFTLFTLDEHFG